MKRKLKVLLLDLPAFTINLNSFKTNNQHIPLASAYLKAYAEKDGCRHVTIDIAPGDYMALAGDAGIVSYILKRHCDVVGFSLYQWNAIRSLHIMREVRKKDRAIRFLAGGPEVRAATDYLLAEGLVDFLVEGEGEEPFRRLLLALTGQGYALHEIPGLIYRDEDHYEINGNFEIVNDMDSIPSPYLLGMLDPALYGYMFIETLRGCNFNCRYCSWKRGGRSGISFFPLQRISRELRLAREKGVHFVNLADSATNVSKAWLGQLCRVIYEENRDHFFHIHGYIHPELLDEESVKWLREANFQYPVIGLQSTNRQALKAIGRHANIDAYLNGASLLEKYGINYTTTIILGLPGDTAEGFSATVDFLASHSQCRSLCLPLSVSPGTVFREEAGRMGLTYQKAPPNLIISTPTMTFSDMKSGVRLFREKICFKGAGNFEKDLRCSRKYNFHPDHYAYYRSIPSLHTYARGAYPWKGTMNLSHDTLERVLSRPSLPPLTKVIFSRQSRTFARKAPETMAALMAPVISWNILLWLEDFGSEEDGKFLKTLLGALSSHNKHQIWHVVLELKEEIPLALLTDLQSQDYGAATVLDHESLYDQADGDEEYMKIAPSFHAVIHDAGDSFSRQWLSELSRYMPLFLNVVLPGDMNDIPECYTGLLVDFLPQSTPSQIVWCLNSIKNSPSRGIIFFRNWTAQRLWSTYCGLNSPFSGPYDSILSMVTGEQSSHVHLSKKALMRHMMEWIESRKGAQHL